MSFIKKNIDNGVDVFLKVKNKNMQLTVKEALEQGYKEYGFWKNGFQSLRDIVSTPPEAFAKEDIVLVEKEFYHPAGISAEDLAELVADHLDDNHASETGDDTYAVYNAIKTLNFTEMSAKISEKLSELNYYRFTDIKLVP